MIARLKEIFGNKCSGININEQLTEFINIPSKGMKFCEAVNYSFDIPLRLNNDNLVCPGARRSTGFDRDDRQLGKTISENNNIPLKFVNSALTRIPKLHDIRHINLGMTEYLENGVVPDLFIIYVQPYILNSLIHKLAGKSLHPSIPPYSLLSVCGNVFANSYINQTISISFGCPESRKHGGIEKNELVVGIPYKIALELVRNEEV